MSVTAVQISERRQKVKTTVSDESIKMRKFISMTMTMLKIGFIGFGGGSALIPVIEDEVVEKDKIVSEEEFNDDVMIASITPGAVLYPYNPYSSISKYLCFTFCLALKRFTLTCSSVRFSNPAIFL